MSQGLLPYTVQTVAAPDAVTARAGLPLVLETLRALGLDRVIADPVQDVHHFAEHFAERPAGRAGAQMRLELAARMRQKHFQRHEVIFHRDDPAGRQRVVVTRS